MSVQMVVPLILLPHTGVTKILALLLIAAAAQQVRVQYRNNASSNNHRTRFTGPPNRRVTLSRTWSRTGA